MATQAVFLDCPAPMDISITPMDISIICGLPAEVECRYSMNSTDGPVECVQIRCPRGHCFNGPAECLVKGTPAVDRFPVRVPRQRPRREPDAA